MRHEPPTRMIIPKVTVPALTSSSTQDAWAPCGDDRVASLQLAWLVYVALRLPSFRFYSPETGNLTRINSRLLLAGHFDATQICRRYIAAP